MARRVQWRKLLSSLAHVVVGSVIAGVALDVFLIPNRIAAGGVSGLATVLNHLTGYPVGATMLVIEIPLFLACIRVFGAKFGVMSLLGTACLAVTVDLLSGRVPTIEDTFLAVAYGGAMAGLGLGIAFKGGGTTGGTDLAARLLHHYTGFSMGQALLLVDSMVITFAGVVFGAGPALYAALVLAVTGRVIDFVQEGASFSKAAFIISANPEPIKLGILTEMNRGVTVLKGLGGYTGEGKEVLLAVVGRSETGNLKRLIRRIDPRAFVIITDVREVLGEGFAED